MQIFAPAMKFLATSIFIILMLLQTFGKWAVMAEYRINKDYIAKNLCENKARPMLHCNGKCQLMKKLAEEEKQNSSNSGSQDKVKFADVLYYHSTSSFCLAIFFAQLPVPFSNYKDLRSNPTSRPVFHPPCV